MVMKHSHQGHSKAHRSRKAFKKTTTHLLIPTRGVRPSSYSFGPSGTTWTHLPWRLSRLPSLSYISSPVDQSRWPRVPSMHCGLGHDDPVSTTCIVSLFPVIRIAIIMLPGSISIVACHRPMWRSDFPLTVLVTIFETPHASPSIREY